MAGGWASDGAVHDQIDDSVRDAVERARSQLGGGNARSHCIDCDEPIPEARRRAVSGAQRCIGCQSEHDAAAGAPGLNRRASKDALLR